MAWYHAIGNLFARKPHHTMRPYVRALPAGRRTQDTADAFFGGLMTVAPPASFDSNWQIVMRNIDSIQHMTPAQLMELMADLSPEISRALWDYLRMCNPGWEVYAYPPGSDEVGEREQAALDAFIAALVDRHGSMDVPVNRIFIGGALRGSFCAELVLDRRGRMPLDLATPDPASIRFRKRSDPELGEVWEPGQWHGSRFVPLSIPTFRNIPIDPLPASPYGRPLYGPALFTCMSLILVMADLRRVIRKQGYPRLDLSVDVMGMLEHAPNMLSNADAFNEFANALIADVANAYSRLQPDDAYIHTSNVEVSSTETANANALAGIDSVIVALERMAIRALKSMPMMFASSDGSTDGESNRQWEIYANTIKALQHQVESILQYLFGLALEAQGIQATVEFRFAEMRAAEMLRDAQTEAMLIANEVAKYEAGWTSQDEAAEAITGHAADNPTPRTGASGGGIVQGDGDGNEALNQDDVIRRRLLDELRATRQDVRQAMGGFSTNGNH